MSEMYGVAPSFGVAHSTGMPAFFHMKPRALNMSVIHISSLLSATASASFEG